MSIRDREVLETLREEPELLAFADAVVETQRLRRVRPFGALMVAAVAAAALLVLILEFPWDRGREAPLLDRARAAVPASGPVAHLTVRMEIVHGKRTLSPVTTESFYDRQRRLVRVISRGDGKVLADYTTAGGEDEFSLFPGLLSGAAFYREALANGRARVVEDGLWRGRPVYWLELSGGGPARRMRIGIDRGSLEPVVFLRDDPDGFPSGLQAAILGLDYVPTTSAGFQTDAPVLVSGRVLGPDCEPVKALVAVSFKGVVTEGRPRLRVDVASTRSTPDGRFTLRADPTKTPFREALVKAKQENGGRLNFDLTAMSAEGAFGYGSFPRFVRDGSWWGDDDPKSAREAVTVALQDGAPSACS